ncbi:MAG: enoyl-CoA hydratase-related protein [Myxococcota bacterium]|nr:enoyl-CoA hydratase-related protein [Myxococcota bacterium]
MSVRFEADAELPHLWWLTLDRPEARNAWSDEMLAAFLAAIDQAEADDEVRCVALTGAGRAFSAGGDLKAMRDKAGMFEGGPVTLRSRYTRGIQSIPRRLARFDKPLIAAVNGAAIGAGLDLACMCDIRVAVNSAKMGSTFVKVGLIPGDGGAWLLSRTIGYPQAMDMILSGRVITAEEGLKMGLVHEVCERDVLEPAVRRRASEILANSPLAVRLAKSAMQRSWDLPMDTALELAATYQGVVQNTDDHLEGVSAILEKRDPEFKGR